MKIVNLLPVYVVIFFIPMFLFAQKQKIQLVDELTKQPLQFVEILYDGENLFSDKNGNVLLDYNVNNIEILDRNYLPNQIEITSETHIVYLQNNVTELEELVISKKPRTIIKPQSKKIFDHFFIDSERIYLNEITFNSEYKNKYLRKISFKSVSELYGNIGGNLSPKDARIAKKTIKNTIQLLRINIFDDNKKILFRSRPFEYTTNGKEFFEIDVEEDVLIGEKPLFVEIQVIGALNADGVFLEDIKNISIRPQQTKLPPKEYRARLLVKEKNSNLDFRDLVKEKRLLESYINFGFEFEDSE